MKFYTKVLLLCLFSFISCNSNENYSAADCIGLKEISKTQTLSILDTLIDFSGVTNNGYDFSLHNLNKDFVFLFFKNIDLNDRNNGTIFLYNSEVSYKNMGKLVADKNGAMIIVNDGKLAKLYGLKLENGFNVSTNTLFISNKQKVINKIYENICEGEILELIKNK